MKRAVNSLVDAIITIIVFCALAILFFSILSWSLLILILISTKDASLSFGITAVVTLLLSGLGALWFYYNKTQTGKSGKGLSLFSHKSRRQKHKGKHKHKKKHKHKHKKKHKHKRHKKHKHKKH